jgi:hypothetical protein
MAEEKEVEVHEHIKTETDEATTETHRETTERDKGGGQTEVVEKERTVEKRD